MYLLTDLAPWPSGVTVGWISTRPFTRKLATTKPLLIPAATLERKKSIRINSSIITLSNCWFVRREGERGGSRHLPVF